jgi:hypothetical protein
VQRPSPLFCRTGSENKKRGASRRHPLWTSPFPATNWNKVMDNPGLSENILPPSDPWLEMTAQRSIAVTVITRSFPMVLL